VSLFGPPGTAGYNAGQIMLRGLVAVILVAATAGCSSEPQRQWLKPGQPYTTADFTRDVSACSRAGVLDEACMKGRGWEPVTGGPPTSDTRPPDPVGGPGIRR
jgi:hypothetical protein